MKIKFENILINRLSIPFLKIVYKIMPKKFKKFIKNKYHKHFSNQNILNNYIRCDFNHPSNVVNKLYKEFKNENIN